MPIVVPCGKCQRKLRVPEHVMGRVIRCPNCETRIRVPALEEATDIPSDEQDIDDDKTRKTQPRSKSAKRRRKSGSKKRTGSATGSFFVKAGIGTVVVLAVGITCGGLWYFWAGSRWAYSEYGALISVGDELSPFRYPPIEILSGLQVQLLTVKTTAARKEVIRLKNEAFGGSPAAIRGQVFVIGPLDMPLQILVRPSEEIEKVSFNILGLIHDSAGWTTRGHHRDEMHKLREWMKSNETLAAQQHLELTSLLQLPLASKASEVTTLVVIKVMPRKFVFGPVTVTPDYEVGEVLIVDVPSRSVTARHVFFGDKETPLFADAIDFILKAHETGN